MKSDLSDAILGETAGDWGCLLYTVNSTCISTSIVHRQVCCLRHTQHGTVTGGAAILAGLAVMAGMHGDMSTGLVLALVAICVALFGMFSERAF